MEYLVEHGDVYPNWVTTPDLLFLVSELVKTEGQAKHCSSWIVIPFPHAVRLPSNRDEIHPKSPKNAVGEYARRLSLINFDSLGFTSTQFAARSWAK
jgi:hypothetical protein